MSWSPSQPPKDRFFLAQDEHGNVGEALWVERAQRYGWSRAASTPLEEGGHSPFFVPKFWQDFPKPLQPRDRFGAKKPYRL